MITNKRSFTIGLLLLITFAAVYAGIMSPIFGNGRNGLEYADDMFNSLSKGSANFIAEESSKAAAFNGTAIDVTITAPDSEGAMTWAGIYDKSGAQATVSGNEVNIKGDMGTIMAAVLADCEAMYNNQGTVISDKHGMDERAAMYATYSSLKAMVKAFEKQEAFQISAGIQSLLQKGVEPAYNYYGIEAKKVADYAGTVTFLMLFYLVYTIWFGFSIYFLFEGVGITTTKAAKKAEA